MKTHSISLESTVGSCEYVGADHDLYSMNEETFANFYNKTSKPFWAYLARVSGSGTLADDLSQESYLRFLGAKAPWKEGEVACRRYLFRIGTNLLRDHYRRKRSYSLEDLSEKELPTANPQKIEAIDSEEQLNEAMVKLRPSERQLLWLAHAEELSYQDISVITGFSLARIRLTLFRSRRKLARVLRQQRTIAGARA
jgi:RNA polymerase sigma-70 factor, ECF subfamily